MFFRICRCHGYGVPLPVLVLVRVGVIADPPNDQSRIGIHQPCGFHLHTQCTIFLPQLVPQRVVSDHLTSGGNQSVTDY